MRLIPAFWRQRAHRHAVAGEYLALASRPLLLADLGLRGGLWNGDLAPTPEAQAYAQGRRSIVLEIMKLAKADASQVYDYLEKVERKDHA